MTAALPSVYTGLAKRFNVATCDLLLLENFEVRTCEDLYYKFPEEADLTAFLMEEMRQQVGEKDADDAIVLVPRDVVLEEAAFNRSDTAKSMRKLWSASRQQARKDTDRLTELAGIFCFGAVDLHCAVRDRRAFLKKLSRFADFYIFE